MSGPSRSAPVRAQLVEAQRALAGAHPGFRPVHAKGIVCSGTFRGSPDARRVTRAPHFQGQSVPSTIRFSNASGDPSVHDGLPNVRALAVKFELPDGKTADILANTIEGFPARTPSGSPPPMARPATRFSWRVPWLTPSPTTAAARAAERRRSHALFMDV